MALSTLVVACSFALALGVPVTEPTPVKDPTPVKEPWTACVKDTGGTCKIKGCNQDRGGDAKVDCNADAKCMCKEGFCALGGVCVDSLPGKDTGGTCKFLGCDAERAAVCKDEKCVCEGDTFATDTYCAKEDDIMSCAKTQYKAGVCRAECQTKTVLTCISSEWWCGDNSKCSRNPEAPWTSSGMITAGFGCTCMEGFCATDAGECVRTAATPADAVGYTQPFPMALVAQGAGYFILFMLCCSAVCRNRGRKVEGMEEYQPMNDAKQ